LHAQNLHYPRILAVLHAGGRGFDGARQLASTEAALDFLRSTATYPMFIKPIQGAFGRGAMSLSKYQKSDDSVLLGNGETVPLDELFSGHSHNLDGGYLFQELLTPHAQMSAICGDRLSGMRMIVFLDDDTPKIYRAVLKVATGDNMSDNFVHGQSGNLLGDVDTISGEVRRIVSGTGLALTEVTHHPDTNQPMLGITVPCWEKLIEYCMAAAPLFPGLRMQHWDFSLCPEGPVPLEANVSGDMDLPQYASGTGIADATMQSYLSVLKRD